MFEELSNGWTMTVFISIMVCLFYLLFLIRLHNGWLYLVPSVMGPILGAVFLMIRPLNPYRSLFADLEGKDEEHIQSDPAAVRMMTLLGSRRAKRVLISSGTLSAVLLCIISWGISVVVDRPLNWTFDVGAVVTVTVIFAIFSLGPHCYFLLRWVFRSWNTTYDARE
jgi:hypothetical protein